MIADHNSRSYQIDKLLIGTDLDNVNFNFEHNGETTNIGKYFYERYQIKLDTK